MTHELFNNPWFLGFLGWFALNIVQFRMDKDIHDDADEKFPVLLYMRKKWDNWLVTAVLTFIWIIAAPQIVGVAGDGAIWDNMMYLGSPIFVQKVYEFIKKYKKNNTNS